MNAIDTVGNDKTPHGASCSSAGTASLAAEKARYERQLADWVHCESSKTPEGKAHIKDLESKLSDVKAKIDAQAQQEADHAKSIKNEAHGGAGPASDQHRNGNQRPDLRLDGTGGYVDVSV